MKKQLLEDFGDSQSVLSPAPLRGRKPTAQPAAPAPASAPAAPPAAAGTHARPKVWRSREPAPRSLPPEPPPQARAAPPIPEPPPLRPEPMPQAYTAPPIPEPPPLRPEPTLGEPTIAPEVASFSSRQPDWIPPHEVEPMPWTERWGRKALGWSLALAGVVALAGAGAWMVRETKVESTLAIVADHSTAQAQPAVVAPPVPSSAAVPEPAMEEPPPLRLLPREAPVTASAAPAPAETPAVEAVAAEPPPALATAATAAAAAAVAAPSPRKAEPAPRPAAKKPAAKRAPERRVAAAPNKREQPAPKKTTKPKAPSERVLARALADAQRSRQESLARPNAAPADTAGQPAAAGTLAETLRLCRAAGYHANACIKRGCEATRFGLVCRG